jgi:hypothetical protein
VNVMPSCNGGGYSESELCEGAMTVSFSNKVNPRTFQMALVVAPPS